MLLPVDRKWGYYNRKLSKWHNAQVQVSNDKCVSKTARSFWHVERLEEPWEEQAAGWAWDSFDRNWNGFRKFQALQTTKCSLMLGGSHKLHFIHKINWNKSAMVAFDITSVLSHLCFHLVQRTQGDLLAGKLFIAA